MKIISLPSPSVILPDSAVVLPGRPMFVPDLADGWVAVTMPALRIGRLGRDIAPRFASRYVDAVTACVRLVLPSVAAGLSAGLLAGLDSSVAFGTWLDASTIGGTMNFKAGDATLAVDLKALTAEAVAEASRYMTLKMGDVILGPAVGDAVAVAPGTRLAASIDGSEVLALKIL